MMSRSKVLFIAEAVTLAHVVRLVTLARSLLERGWDVVLATDPRYAPMIGRLDFPVVPIYSMPAAKFQRAIEWGFPIFDFATLDRYVGDELALMKQTGAQLVVGDFRISLAVSARLARIPFVNLTNAYWSPLATIRRPVPEFKWVRWIGLTNAERVYRVSERPFSWLHSIPINRLRKKHGLSSIGSDFRAALMDGDVTCFADLPVIIPTSPLPTNQHFIGPVQWSPPAELPAWWPSATACQGQRPIVYVALGSSGPTGGLQNVLDGLADLPLQVIASTAGRAERLHIPKNAHVAALLPGGRACAVADLVVCNGGSPGTYQALGQGKPVIGVATNMDQFLNMAAVEQAGCGRLVRSGLATAEAVKRIALGVLGDKAMAACAQSVCAAASIASASDIFSSVVLPDLLSGSH